MSRSDKADQSARGNATASGRKGRKRNSQPEQRANKTAAGLNEWTLMIYHSGETELSEEFVWALKEIARVGTPDKVEVVALMDSVSPDLWMFTVPRGTANGKAGAAGEGRPNEDREGGLFNGDVLSAKKISAKDRKQWEGWRPGTSSLKDAKWIDKPDFASSEMLFNFVIHCMREHPALRYMLILSGHGAGMIGETLLLDQGSGRYMSVPMLSWALDVIIEEIDKVFKKEQRKVQRTFKEDFDRTGKQERDPRIDILGFDACGMLTVEVASLLRRRAKYIVGSEDIMHRAGWPYHLILERLIEKNNAEPDDLAAETVRRCMRFYSDFARVGLSIEMSAVEMKKTGADGEGEYHDWEALLAALKSLTKKLLAGIKDPSRENKSREGSGAHVASDPRVRNAILVAHWYAQSFAVEQYVDLQDFCEQLRSAAPEFTEDCDAIIAAVKKVVKKSRYSGSAVQHSHGLSLFFPWVATDAQIDRYSYYTPIDSDETEPTPFNKATGWGDFLREFIYATRREVRDGNGDLIFMPPPGYRDHFSDHYAISTTGNSGDFNVPPSGRRTPPDPRRTPPDPRLSAGCGGVSFAKIKNPALAFHEGRPDDDDDHQDSGK